MVLRSAANELALLVLPELRGLEPGQLIETLDETTLRAFRVQCEGRSEGTDIENTMLEVLDGQIALRQSGVEPRSETEG